MKEVREKEREFQHVARPPLEPTASTQEKSAR
jgi:hypothetical protein